MVGSGDAASGTDPVRPGWLPCGVRSTPAASSQSALQWPAASRCSSLTAAPSRKRAPAGARTIRSPSRRSTSTVPGTSQRRWLAPATECAARNGGQPLAALDEAGAVDERAGGRDRREQPAAHEQRREALGADAQLDAAGRLAAPQPVALHERRARVGRPHLAGDEPPRRARRGRARRAARRRPTRRRSRRARPTRARGRGTTRLHGDRPVASAHRLRPLRRADVRLLRHPDRLGDRAGRRVPPDPRGARDRGGRRGRAQPLRALRGRRGGRAVHALPRRARLRAERRGGPSSASTRRRRSSPRSAGRSPTGRRSPIPRKRCSGSSGATGSA